jgi:hypothetical protein
MNAPQLSHDAQAILHEVLSANRMIYANYDVAPNLKYVIKYAMYIVSDVCNMVQEYDK